MDALAEDTLHRTLSDLFWILLHPQSGYDTNSRHAPPTPNQTKPSLDLANLLRYSAQLREEAGHLLEQMQRLDLLIAAAFESAYNGGMPDRKDERGESQRIAAALAKAAGAESPNGEDLPSDSELQRKHWEAEERGGPTSGQN